MQGCRANDDDDVSDLVEADGMTLMLLASPLKRHSLGRMGSGVLPA
jgi:hypothetical protein